MDDHYKIVIIIVDKCPGSKKIPPPPDPHMLAFHLDNNIINGHWDCIQHPACLCPSSVAGKGGILPNHSILCFGFLKIFCIKAIKLILPHIYYNC